MKKNITLSIVFFIAGFLMHALIFPDVLSNGVTDIQQLAIPKTQTEKVTNESNDEQFTKITFDGERFSRNNITVGFTRYLQIINDNETKLMWLVSNVPELTTKRGFGYKEAVQTQCNKKGQFVVINKNNPQEKLVITVK